LLHFRNPAVAPKADADRDEDGEQADARHQVYRKKRVDEYINDNRRADDRATQ
jgi:hypothetical protein